MKVDREEGERQYKINGQLVDLKYTNYNNPQSSENIVIFPGFGMNHNSQSLNLIAEEYSIRTGMNSHVIYTRQDSPVPSFNNRAQAVRQFTKEEGLENLYTIGYSEGGSIATIFAHSNENVRALILLAPMGLEKQNKFYLAYRFALSALVLGPIQALQESKGNKEIIKRHFETGTHVRNNLIEEIKQLGLAAYANKLQATLIDLSASNLEIFKTFDKPLIIIQGRKDIVSKPLKSGALKNAKLNIVEELSNHNFPFYNTSAIVSKIISNLEQ